MGISTAGLLYYTVGFERSVKGNIESRENEVLTTQIVLNNIKSLLIAKNIDEKGQIVSRNTYGVCSLLKKTQIVLGTEQLYFNFRHIQTQPNSWSKKRWQVFFPPTEWTVLNNPSACIRIDPKFSNSSLKRCIEYKGANPDSSAQTFVIAEINPLMFPNGKAISLSTQAIDPKTVMFSLTAKVGTYQHTNTKKAGSTKQKITYFHRATELMSASSVGECHVQTQSNEWTTAQFSGTGTGTNFDRLVINDSLYKNQKQCSQIQIGDINRNVVQSGSISSNNPISLRSITSLNARLSCTTNRFRCLKNGGKAPSFKDSEIDPFNFTFSVVKNRAHPVFIKNVHLTFKTKNSGTEWDGTNNRQLDRVQSFGLFENTNRPPLLYANTNTDQKYLLNTGSTELTANINSSQMDGYCRSICQQSNGVYPVIDIDTPEDKTGACFKKDFSQSDKSYQIKCTVCYMKACHRIGFGTFGPLHQNSFSIAQLSSITNKQQIIQGLPDEPLDAQVPECHIQNTSHSTQSPNRFPKEVEEKGGKPAGDLKTCFAVQVSKEDDFKNLYNLNYSKMNCNNKRPVLCFMGGHYLPAFSIAHNTQSKLEKVSFNEAESACYRMGREIGSLKSLSNLFHRAYRPIYVGNALPAVENTVKKLPNSNGNYDFINNAIRGMFLAPVNRHYRFIPNGKIKNLINKMLSKNSPVKMWVGFELDGGGLPVAKIPWASVAKDHPFSLFFHKNSTDLNNRPTLLKDTNTLGSNSGKHLALTYNIRWKGLVPYSKKAYFVCFNPKNSKYFISKTKDTLNNANKICSNQNGIFIPPINTEDWIRTMLVLNKNDNQYAFPDPFPNSGDEGNSQSFVQTPDVLISSQVEAPLAYIALTGTSNVGKTSIGPYARDLRFYVPELPTHSSSVFNSSKNHSSITKTGINYKGIPKDLCSQWPNQKKLYLCIDRITKIPTRLATTNTCPSGEIKITNLQAGNKNWRPQSFRYMAKFYSLLKKDISADKKALVIVNKEKSNLQGCIEEGVCQPGYYRSGNQCCISMDEYSGDICYDSRCSSSQYYYSGDAGCVKRCPGRQIWNGYSCTTPYYEEYF